MATVSKLFCTGSRRTLANRCLSILYCDRFPKDVLLATSSASTCGRVGGSDSLGNGTTTRPIFSMQCTP